ncbi:fibrinogen-like protein 1 isoform X2 [Cherax quadricarinatus]
MQAVMQGMRLVLDGELFHSVVCQAMALLLLLSPLLVMVGRLTAVSGTLIHQNNESDLRDVSLNHIPDQHVQDEERRSEQDMKSAVDDLSQLIQDNSNMLRELSQTLTSYVSQHASAAAATAADPQDGEHKDVDIQQLVPIIDELRHKFLQQEVKVEQIKEQVLLKDNIILEREETLRELQTKAQQLEETIMKQRKAVKQECEAEIRNLPTKKPSHSPARDCTDIRLQGETLSGVYQIFPESSPSGVNVMCQMEEEAAWTVFLARHRQTVQENFTRTWQDYKTGFGDPHAEYWLGNDNLHALTAGDHSYRLKVVATNLRGEHQSAEWDTFAVADESNKYRLTLKGYNSTSSLFDALTGVKDNSIEDMSFSTVDMDNDDWSDGSCVVNHDVGGGWWYRRCGAATPTAPIGNTDGKHKVMCWASTVPGGNLLFMGLSHLLMMVRENDDTAA